MELMHMNQPNHDFDVSAFYKVQLTLFIPIVLKVVIG